MFKEYHKIETLFERDPATKKLIIGKFKNETVEYLKDNEWVFTEKIDGTNIRVYWDGHKVRFGGRTDNAQFSAKHLNYLENTFGGEINEQLFEQKFGSTPVILYGELYGAGIQKEGAKYRKDIAFILFDVLVNGTWWLRRPDVQDVAEYFKVEVVPVLFCGTIEEGIDYVLKHEKSTIGTAKMEGIVGRPKIEVFDRGGKRVIVKIKRKDFK